MKVCFSLKALVCASMSLILAACNSTDGPASLIEAQKKTPASKSSCVSSDPDRLCIAVKFVSYTNSDGVPIADETEANRLVEAANDFWKQCNISFQIEDYQAVDAESSNLPTGSRVENGTIEIRRKLSTENQFLLVLTEAWPSNKAGWAQMPGDGPFGAVMDGPYAVGGKSGDITIAHELGHYQGLDHVSGNSNLMYPQAVTTSYRLSDSECELARKTDIESWSAMLR